MNKFLVISIFYLFLTMVLAAKKLYEQSCATSSDCNQSLGLTCQGKVCKCDPHGATVYSLTHNRCVGAAGRECLQVNSTKDSNFLCVDNSICTEYEYMRLCSCKEGFYQSTDGNCYAIADFGGTCIQEEFSCGDTLSTSISCVEGKCGCLLGEDNQYFDRDEKKCVSYAGGQCLPEYYKSCTKNSYCGELQEKINGASFVIGHKCLCAPGYSYTRNKQCLARYGTNCDINNPCNYDKYLDCLNGRCQCRNILNEIYNERTHQCAILVGSMCKLGTNGQRCVDHAECISEKPVNKSSSTNVRNNEKFGKCQCGTGYSTTPDNTCLLDINEKCEPGQCNFHNGLTCVNGTCGCIDSYLSYDKVSQRCVSLTGLPCGVTNLFQEPFEIFVTCESSASCVQAHDTQYPRARHVCKPIKQ